MFLFHSKQWADDLKLMGHRAKLRFVNGFALFTSEKYVETFSTPKEKIAEKERITLYYFAPKKPVKKHRPTLFIPPLMTPAYVYDLRKGHSFIEYMLSQGRSIYLLDFGNPSENEANIQLDSYLYEAVEYAIDKTLQHSKAKKINLIGYSMGGIFTYLYTGVFGAKNISAIITLGSPVDFSKIWLFSFLVRILGRRAGHLSKQLGNIPGGLVHLGFKAITPIKSTVRTAELFMKMYDEEYVKGYDAVHQWLKDFLDWPGGSFRQFLKDIVRDNKLSQGEMILRDNNVDLSKITCPLLCVIGGSDTLAPQSSITPIKEKVGSKKVTFHIVPGAGHLGLVVGNKAEELVWTFCHEWLSKNKS